jgi:hypothetical protein
MVAVGRVVAPEVTPTNYVANFITPVEPDLYLIIFDWNAGVLTPEESVTLQLIVQGVALSALRLVSETSLTTPSWRWAEPPSRALLARRSMA